MIADAPGGLLQTIVAALDAAPDRQLEDVAGILRVRGPIWTSTTSNAGSPSWGWQSRGDELAL